MVVEVVAEGAERPPAGTSLVVQVLDTTYADAAAVIAEASTEVGPDEGEQLQTVELPFSPTTQGDYRIRAHVDVDGDGAISLGDYITTHAYPACEGTPCASIVTRSGRAVSEQFRERAGDRLAGPLLDEQELARGVHLEEHVLALRRAAHVDRAVDEPQPLPSAAAAAARARPGSLAGSTFGLTEAHPEVDRVVRRLRVDRGREQRSPTA